MHHPRVRTAFGVVALVGFLAAALGLGGCIIVVDGDHDGYYANWNHESRQARIGVEISQPGAALAKQLGVDRDRTTLIDQVYSGSPADRAGLQKFDLITQVNGNDDACPANLRKAIRSEGAGESIRLRVVRDGKPTDVSVPVAVP